MRMVGWVVAVLASMLISSAAMAEDLAGEWHGTIEANGQTLRVALHVKKTDAGYEGTADSLDTGLDGLVLADIVTDGQTLSFSVLSTDGTYQGKWDEASHQWVGQWTQGTAAKLDFVRGAIKP
jgi:hypothetical protein